MTDVAERTTLSAPQVAIEAGTVALRDAAPSPAIAEGPGSLLNAIVQMARDPSVDVAKLSALLAMQERMEARQAEVEFNRALARLPAIRVKKNGRIDLTRKDGTSSGSVPFARWEDIAAIIDPLMQAEGFRLIFDSQPRAGEGGGLVVTGTLLHRDGHSRSASMPLAIDTGPGRNNLQAMGSTLSYGKRYAAEMLLNIVREDDDDGKRGGTKMVSRDDAEHIRLLIRDTKTTEADFLRNFFEVAEVENLSEQSAIAAKNMLLTKQRAMQKSKGEPA